MVHKIYYTEKTVRGWIQDIIRAMDRDQWRPDYIVGITRGGLVPAIMLSHYFEIPMHTLNVSLRDGTTGPESNLWMAEDAFGYVPQEEQTLADFDYSIRAKNILLVDDINDSGTTMNWIKEDWPSGCLPDHPRWDNVWNQNVRFAVLINNEASGFKDVDYSGTDINKVDDPIWCVFPWEEWWR
jgi:hypoxanthine phosphoribosyltransferase